MKNNEKPKVFIQHLYELGLRKAVEIEAAIDAVQPAGVPRYDSERLQKSTNAFAAENPFPHQSTFFVGDIPSSREAFDKVKNFTAAMDALVAGDLGLERARPRPLPIEKKANVLDKVTNAFKKKSTGPSLEGLQREGMAMRNVLRVLKVAQTGVEPGNEAVVNKGYFTPKIQALFMDKFPEAPSLEDWKAIVAQTLNAMKPVAYDEGVISVYWPGNKGPSGFLLPEGQRHLSHEFGVTLLGWGYNEHGISPETQRYTIQERFAYAHDQIHFKNGQEAELAFAGVMRAKTLGDIADALGTQEDEGRRDWITEFRHTGSGNFVGGSFSSDVRHPHPIVANAANATYEHS